MLVEIEVLVDGGTRTEYINPRSVSRVQPGPKPKSEEEQPSPLSLLALADNKTVVRVPLWPREVQRLFETRGGGR